MRFGICIPPRALETAMFAFWCGPKSLNFFARGKAFIGMTIYKHGVCNFCMPITARKLAIGFIIPIQA
jgi:hypothetical protein